MWTEQLERLTGTIERSGLLESWGRALTQPVSSVIRPGVLKDLASGTWMSHPTHPMLTDVVIGAWTSSFLLDILGGPESRVAADRLVLAGVLSAVPTAVTGLSDLIDVTSREERAVGVAHALSNVTALSLYGTSYLLRRRGRRALGTSLSMLGAAAATLGGFLGGHLSYRRGVGVDQTAFERRPSRWTAVLDDSDLAEGKPRLVTVEGAGVALVRQGDRIHALASRCTHRGGPLHKGKVEGGAITCPWHLSSFRLEDGSVLRGPATAPQPAYETRVSNGRIEIRAAKAAVGRGRSAAGELPGSPSGAGTATPLP